MQLQNKHIQLTPQGAVRLCQLLPARDKTIHKPLSDMRRKSRPLQKIAYVCVWYLLEYYKTKLN
jgi:hypothetical protein